MKVTKGIAFLITACMVFVWFVIVLLSDLFGKTSYFTATAPLLVDALKLVSLGFITLSVADNGVKGKFYRAELDKEEECAPKDSGLSS